MATTPKTTTRRARAKTAAKATGKPRQPKTAVPVLVGPRRSPDKRARAATTYLECQVTLWGARGQLGDLDRYLTGPRDEASTIQHVEYADAVRAAAVILRASSPQATPPPVMAAAHAGPVKDEAILPEEREWRGHDHARSPVAEVVPDVAIIGSQTFRLDPPAEEHMQRFLAASDGEDTTDTPGGSELRAHNSPGGQTPGPGGAGTGGKRTADPVTPGPGDHQERQDDEALDQAPRTLTDDLMEKGGSDE